LRSIGEPHPLEQLSGAPSRGAPRASGQQPRLLVPGPLVAGQPLSVLPGRWLASRGLLVTAIAVRA
jgi:hypothetical protein